MPSELCRASVAREKSVVELFLVGSHPVAVPSLEWLEWAGLVSEVQSACLSGLRQAASLPMTTRV